MGPSAGLAVKPFCWRAKRRQRCRELYVTPAIRATTVADSPASTNSTARRRLRSNSAAVPIGLIFILYAAVLVSLAAPSAVTAQTAQLQKMHLRLRLRERSTGPFMTSIKVLKATKVVPGFHLLSQMQERLTFAEVFCSFG